ncbi:hypothetical protein DUNSADRAFT_18676 [Dunaliella salina]|uniref:Uncharacterized protein n=2 Tax=Dunaliella salina TaxID=3046 RepID=A0ABQ7FZR1_DUNSA|nr:hypothetical protein DUNSADRAFT_18676 [Dunaliella salina]|eukprot:KAF5827833.1 hypothetical protein DUNSADRAFT_18676 [Dunaliella salina]
MPAAPRTPEKPAQRPKRSRYGSDFKKMASRKLLGQMQGLRNWCTTPSNKISPDGNGSKMSICSLKTYRSNEVLVYLYFGFLHREKGRDAVKLQLRDVTVQGCQAYMEHLRACGGKANYVANVGKVLARVMHYMDCTAGTRKPKTETHAPQKVASLARQMKVAMLRQDVDHDGLALPDVRALQLFYSKLEESAMGMLKVVIRETKAIRKMPNEPQALLELALNVLSADSLTREQAWLLQAAALMCLAGGRGLPPLRSSALSLLKCNKAAQSSVALRGVHALLLWCVEKYARPALLGCKEDTQGFLFLTKTGKAFQPSNFAPWFHGLVEEYGEGLLGNVCPQQIRHIWVRFLRQKEEQDSQHMQLMSRNGSGGITLAGGASIMGNSEETCLKRYDVAGRREIAQRFADEAATLYAQLLGEGQHMLKQGLLI